MISKCWQFIEVSLFLMLISICVIAQTGATGATISGVVTDEQGAIIPGALLIVKNLQTNISREVRSNEDGSFNILQLPPSEYEVTVNADGFAAKTTRIELELGKTALLTLRLKLGEVSDVVEITASALFDLSKTESSTNNDRQRIDTLPINRRDFLNFSLTGPRAVADRTPVQGVSATSGISFNGQPARFNNITIDGLENNEPGAGSVRATFSQEAVQEFQVVSDSYSAEFGRALGGIINIVTRGGSNDLHGGIFFLNRNDSISARNAFATVNPEYKQYQFGATLSGPIQKNKTFYFLSFERLSIKQNNIVTISDDTIKAINRGGFPLRNGPLPFAVGTTTALGRLDTHLTTNNALVLRYNFAGTYNGALETFGGLVGNTSAGIQELTDNSIAATNTYINAGANLINETRFLYGRRDQDVTTADPGPQIRIVAPEGLVTFGRGTFLPQVRAERFYQFVDNVSLSRGRNQIKFGADFLYINFVKDRTTVPLFPGGIVAYNPINFSQLSGIPNLPVLSGIQAFDPSLRTAEQRAFLMTLTNIIDQFAPGFPTGLPLVNLPLPTIYAQGFGDTRLPINEKLFSLFAQDNLTIAPNLLIKFGLRYDISRETFRPDNRGNFSPRIAISYNPKKLPKMSLRASYGLFYGTPLTGPASLVQTTSTGILKIPSIPFPFSILPILQPGGHFPDSNTLPSNVNFIPQLSTAFDYQKDLRDSYTQQGSFGIDYLLNNNNAISVNYNYVRGIKLFSVRNINPVVRPVSNPLHSLITGRVDPTRGDVFQFESAFDSYFHAVTFSFIRRLSNNIGFTAYYTLSKTIDNFSDIRNDLLEIQDPLKPGLERALSLQDVRNRFVFSGSWDLNYTKNIFLRDFQLSTIITLNSGRPFNLVVGQDLDMNGDNNPPGDRPLGIGRNAGIAPGFANVDLRLTRTIKFNDRARLQLFVEAFNLFNRVNISELDRVFPPDANGNFNLPPQENGRYIATPDRFRGAFDPRQFQFGIRANF